MFTKLAGILVLTLANAGIAWAQVDINRADQAALEGIKGVGPAMSKAILDERSKGGSFKDWGDVERRVKGVGSASSKRLSQAGLTVNGQSLPEVKTNTAFPGGKNTAAK